jgi:hypothetical protein
MAKACQIQIFQNRLFGDILIRARADGEKHGS